jgi:hypothetical protein
VGYGTCVASFVLGHVLCYCDFFAHAEMGNDVLFYLGQCLIYSASFLGFRLFLAAPNVCRGRNAGENPRNQHGQICKTKQTKDI